MGLFTKKEKLKIVPRTAESKAGGKFLMERINESTPQIPVREVQELTPIQQLIQQQLGDILKGSGESTKLAKGEMTKTLTDKYDPRTSDYYRGLRQEAERLKTEGVTDIRQAANLGGMLQSSPTVAAEQSLINTANSQLLQQLGQMYETERERKGQAAKDIQGVEAANISNVAAIGGVADQKRAVEQMRSDAIYQAAIQQILFPYREQSAIAQALLGVQNQAYMTGGGLTDLGFGLQVASGAVAQGVGSYYGAKAGAAAGA